MAKKLPSPSEYQGNQKKVLGGMPPEKSVKEIMKVNTPDGRSPSPDGFRPRR